MKDFDKEWEARRSEEARTFQVCGETFVLKKAVRPEALSPFIEAADSLGEDSTLADTMQALDALFLQMVEHGDAAEDRYRALRAEEEDGLSVDDIREIVEWMTEEQTNRPTVSPSDSTGGRKPTGRRSTAGSSSPALAEA